MPNRNSIKGAKGPGLPVKKVAKFASVLRSIKDDRTALEKITEELKAEENATAEIVEWLTASLQINQLRSRTEQRKAYELAIAALVVGIAVGRKTP